MNDTRNTVQINFNENDDSKLHCGKDALTDMFGWFLQILLACLAFTCLILKRFCEPRFERRPWLIWFYDTSKQGMGALVIHLANVYLASNFNGDPCTWYIINFLLDSSVGLFIVYIGIRISQHLSRTQRWEAINFGEYGKPPSINAWLAQCCLYVLLMVLVKVIITLLIQLDFWDGVRDLILSPITNPRVELAIVMLVIPFFVNVFIFWVTDNFLMVRHRTGQVRRGGTSSSSGDGFLRRVKVRYRRLSKERRGAECDGLLGTDADVDADVDEELLGARESLQPRSLGLLA